MLPDDVAIRTTNQHGHMIKRLSDLSLEWVEQYDETDPFMSAVMLDAHDDLDAALYNAITGFYRLSISATRSALELVAIRTWAKVFGKTAEFKLWESGDADLTIGKACDGLIAATKPLHDELKNRGVEGTLFNQKTKTTQAGLVRRAFSRLSQWTHSNPGYRDSAIHNTNWPIYVPGAFDYSARMQAEVVGVLCILTLIASPKTRFNQIIIDLFKDELMIQYPLLRDAFAILHR
jgi:hypothetical protein